MQNANWVVLAKMSGEFQAELIRGLLEAQGVPVRLIQEGAARAIGLTFGPMGEIRIMVPAEKLQEAQLVIMRYEAGEFENWDAPPSE